MGDFFNEKQIKVSFSLVVKEGDTIFYQRKQEER